MIKKVMLKIDSNELDAIENVARLCDVSVKDFIISGARLLMSSIKVDVAAHERKQRSLKEKLADFGVDA